MSLEGFCHESKHQILVYEYLPGGSLGDQLYGTNASTQLSILYIFIFMRVLCLMLHFYFLFPLGTNNTKTSLSWVRRLKIAVDAAKGTTCS